MDRLPALAEELVRLNSKLVVARATPPVQAAKNATTTIPIVMLGVADAVGSGFVASLARPGGNITGTTNIMPKLAGKRLELLQELLPKFSGWPFWRTNQTRHTKLFVREAQQAAERFTMKFHPVVITTPTEIESAFSTMARESVEALIIQPLFTTSLRQGAPIAQLAVKNRLPTISDGTGFPEAGGLMLYGPNQMHSMRRGATYVDRILKGAKPADLPVQQPTEFELVINLKAAKQIGLTIPPSVLASADKVIK